MVRMAGSFKLPKVVLRQKKGFRTTEFCLGKYIEKEKPWIWQFWLGVSGYTW
jgi:hypothetical protein